MVLPGENSVIVPLPSVVVVVVVVSETCAHANGAAIANAMLNITFFICTFLLHFAPRRPSEFHTNPLAVLLVIGICRAKQTPRSTKRGLKRWDEGTSKNIRRIFISR